LGAVEFQAEIDDFMSLHTEQRVLAE